MSPGDKGPDWRRAGRQGGSPCTVIKSCHSAEGWVDCLSSATSAFHVLKTCQTQVCSEGPELEPIPGCLQRMAVKLTRHRNGHEREQRFSFSYHERKILLVAKKLRGVSTVTSSKK